MKTGVKEKTLQGIPISYGISIGKLVYFAHEEEVVEEYAIKQKEVKAEIERFDHAIQSSKKDLLRLKKSFEKEGLVEAAAILDTQIQVLDDPLMTDEVREQVRTEKKNIEYLFSQCVNCYVERFEQMRDPFFRERGRDLIDIARRVLSYLTAGGKKSVATLSEGSVVYSHEITASDAAEADPKKTLALISDEGGVTSHAAIVAKAKGIPYIAGVSPDHLKEASGTIVVVDGRGGKITLFPKRKTVDTFRMLQAQQKALFSKLEEGCQEKPVTKDGKSVTLLGNVEMVSEIDQLHRFGGAGVGLYRSEFIYLTKQCFPSEEEQYEIYCNIIKKMKGLPLTIRTFDIGGDKFICQQQIEESSNPFLGCRAIRFLLQEKEIFKAQLRAIYRASTLGPVSLMFPMISDLCELLEVKELIKEVQKEVFPKKKDRKDLPLGCMIEVPSAVITADLIAKECDFLAIGTNDLLQYLLAVDRSNNKVNKLYTPMQPALIRSLDLTVQRAKEGGATVSLCGEAAGDPRFTPLLIGLGVDALSVSLRNLPLIKKAIRHVSHERSRQLAKEALALSCADDIKTLLDDELLKTMPSEFHSLTMR